MADNQDFFEEEQVSEVQEPEKFKIGEKEYSQDDLSRFVGLGERAAELEEKWNTKIDRLAPEYTKSRQELAELKKWREEQEKIKETAVQTKVEEGAQLSPEEQAQLIKQELRKYGVVTEEDIFQKIATYNAAIQLNQNIDNILNEAKTDGKPTATRDELLAYMEENGVKNPTAAYKLKFEDELRSWEQKQVQKIKQPGLVTESSSSAGGKEPAPVKVTKDNIAQLLAAELGE